ncbi:MAG: PEP-CTERM sorting domain-containing protein [Burkholderiaceae bacterium]|nr:PEP-CTERM sorting domain-containing protein [Burkholderiaceae bacterium]
MKKSNHLASACLLAATFCCAPAWAGSYQVHELTRSGYNAMLLRDINNMGDMLGMSSSYETGVSKTFIYSNGEFVDLPKYGNSDWGFGAKGITDDRVVVGILSGITGERRGGILANNVYQTFTLPDATDVEFSGVSPDGHFVTGRAYVRDADDNLVPFYGFVLDRSTQMVKKLNGPAEILSPNGINNAGMLTAWGGFVYDIHTDTYQQLHSADGGTFVPYELSDTGFLAAYSFPGYFNPTPESAYAGRLGALEKLEIEGASVAFGVNDAGTVVGIYGDNLMDSTSTRAFYAVASVPEPATWALWLGAGLVLGIAASRRKRARSPAG